MDGIPYVDLSVMLQPHKCAVVCRDVEELNIFYLNAQKQLSGYLQWDHEDIRDVWDYYKDRTGFTLFADDGVEPSSMSYCSDDWFVGDGYEIIELSDLCNILEIEESDQPVSALFGGIV